MYPRTGSSERSPRRWVSPPRRTRTSHLNQGDPGDLSAWAIASFLSPLIHRSAWRNCLENSWTGLDRMFFGCAKRRKGRLSPRSADSWDHKMEPIRIFQTVSEGLFSEVRLNGVLRSSV